MADKQKEQEEQKAQEQADEFREDLQNAYAYVEGQKAVQSFSALTPEDCFDRFIGRVEGKDTIARPNVLHRIENVKARVLASIAKIKTMPPEAFKFPRGDKDVNTPVKPSDE